VEEAKSGLLQLREMAAQRLAAAASHAGGQGNGAKSPG
jgi:hypothetical protein